ncbi:MAG: prolyl oligopeptidase family serine peptidase [Candidatus Micrarchaeia archaeon]
MRYLALLAVLFLAGCISNTSRIISVNSTMDTVSQASNSNPAVQPDFTVQVVTYSASPYELKGYLYTPKGAGPFPAIVYNHGSEPQPGPKEAVASFFASHGYVVFVPHRRGQGLSSGPYVGDMVSGTPLERRQAQLDQLLMQADDVSAAFSYLKGLSVVDPGRMAVMGCSYGGIETVFTSERQLGLKAAVDFAGASESWAENPLLDERLKQAVHHSTVPIFFSRRRTTTTPSLRRFFRRR